MSTITHVPFYPSDWLSGTRGMTAAQMGVYITLLAMMYERAGPIRADDMARLARLCGTSASALSGIISGLVEDGKLTRVEGGLFNRRAELEIKNVMSKSEVARAKANSKWGKSSTKSTKDECSGIPPAMLANSHKPIEEENNTNRLSVADNAASVGARPDGHGRADLSDAKIWSGIERRLAEIPESRLIADPFTGPMIKLAAEFDLEAEIIPTLAAELRRPGGSPVRTWSLMATRVRERMTADRAATARGEMPQIRGSPIGRPENPLVLIGRQAMREIKAKRA